LTNTAYGMKLKKVIKYVALILLTTLILTSACQRKDDKIDIKFSTWGSETEISILRPIIEDFNQENPDIHVEIMHIPQNYFQKLHMLVAAIFHLMLFLSITLICQYTAPETF
jgi:ABC-type glycerol-3-phosphate transport system substrate-binding protein